MTRLKFLVLTLVALGLWLASGAMSAPAAAARMVEQGSAQAAQVPAAVALALESQRSALQAALLQSSGPALWTAGPKAGAKVEAPNAERLNAVRAVVGLGMTDAQRGALVLAVVNDAGGVVAQGAADAVAPPEGLDLKALAQAGAKGAFAQAFGATCYFLSAPLPASDHNEVKAWGTVVVGLPVTADLTAALDALTKSGGVAAAGLAVDGKLIAASGEKTKAEAALKVKAGTSDVLTRGTALAVGPVSLPNFTSGDAMGGQAPLAVASRQVIAGTPFEVVAVVSLEPAMQALAGGQKTGLMFLVALLALGLVFTALGGGASTDDDDVGGAPMRSPSPSGPARQETSARAKLPLAEAPPPAEASPDDFQFGAAPVVPAPTAPEPGRGESVAEFGGAAAVPLPGGVGASLGDEEDASTRAYPTSRPPPAGMETTEQGQAFDPFTMAAGGDVPQPNPDDESATRVSAIPEELLKASARNTGETAVPASIGVASSRGAVAAPVAPMAGATEESHFQDVYKEFVTTRERCGEPSDGLTYEKFSAKLRKNKEQLVAKYSCKTVRFQVYVKDGKAALKATPVKD